MQKKVLTLTIKLQRLFLQDVLHGTDDHFMILLLLRSEMTQISTTQGLKITEEKVLPLLLHLQMVKTFKSSRINTNNVQNSVGR